MPHDDPTDNALAAIASILDQTTTPPGPAKAADNPPATVEEPPPPVDEEAPAAVTLPPPLPQADEPTQSEPEPSEAEQIQPIEAKVQPIEANGYSKTGPGPMAALRFRWTVREDGGRYYVDETFGEDRPRWSTVRWTAMPRSSSSTIARPRHGSASSISSRT